jgi:hypothetical protein
MVALRLCLNRRGRGRINEYQGGAASAIFFSLFFQNNKYVSLTGGSLGSWVDEDRSQMR